MRHVVVVNWSFHPKISVRYAKSLNTNSPNGISRGFLLVGLAGYTGLTRRQGGFNLYPFLGSIP
jgi:hypothetical protein